MLKTIALAVVFVAAFAFGTATAQTSGQPASQGAGSAPSTSAATPMSNKDIISSCRTQAKSKGLRGTAMKSSVDDCVSAQNPKLAAHLRCIQQGKSQGIAAGDAMKTFVKSCLKQAKS